MGDSSTVFQFPVSYAGANHITLNESNISLSGVGAQGCTKSVTNAEVFQTVSVTGCTGNGPMMISVSGGTASDDLGNFVPAFGPSVAVMVGNAIPNVSFSTALDIEYPGLSSPQKYDFYYPSDYESRQNIPIFVWIHGGAWTGGDKLSDAALAENIARLGFLVVNTNYTLAPVDPSLVYPVPATAATPYRAGMEDIHALMSRVLTSASQYHGDTTKITIAGGSAGGHLALYEATRPDNLVQFNCVINASGPTDLESLWKNNNYPYSAYLVERVFGNIALDLRNSSPANKTASLKANHVLLAHEIQDNLVPIDQALLFASNVQLNQPWVDLTLNYFNDNNSFPLFKPAAAEANHVWDSGRVLQALSFYVNSRCR